MSKRDLYRLVRRSVRLALERGADQSACNALLEQAARYVERLDFWKAHASGLGRPQRMDAISRSRERYSDSIMALDDVARALASPIRRFSS